MLTGLLTVSLLLGTGGIGVAQTSQRAISLYDVAMKLFHAGKYREAIAAFERSHLADPHPNNLYNAGEAYRRLGDMRKSHHFYKRYADTLGGNVRQRLLAKLDRLRWGKECVASVITQPGGAQVFLDGKEIGLSPKDGTALEFKATGGKRRLEIRLAGYVSVLQPLVAEFGEPQSVSVQLKAVPSTQPATKPFTGTIKETANTRNRRANQTSSEGTSKKNSKGGGVTIHAWAGPAFTDYGDKRLEKKVEIEFGLRAGYLWRWSWLGVEADVGVMGVTVAEGNVQESSAFFLNITGALGVRAYVYRRLWVGIRLSVGPTILLGAGKDSLFFSNPDDPGNVANVIGVFANVLVRPGVVAGWSFENGLSVMVSPFTMDYSPRFSEFSPNISHILRYNMYLGIGWQ